MTSMPCSLASSRIRTASARLPASGFSKITWTPSGAANSTISRWRLFSTNAQMTSGFLERTNSPVVGSEVRIGLDFPRLLHKARNRFRNPDELRLRNSRHVLELAPAVSVPKADETNPDRLCEQGRRRSRNEHGKGRRPPNGPM